MVVAFCGGASWEQHRRLAVPIMIMYFQLDREEEFAWVAFLIFLKTGICLFKCT